MPFGVGYVIAFILGGIIFRYFEEIRNFLLKVRKDINKVHRDSSSSFRRIQANQAIKLNLPGK
jgi:hypothetical protein